MTALGNEIRKRRLAEGVSLRQFAERVGISPSFQSDIENGRRMPSEEVLQQIADSLGVQFDTLKAQDPRLDQDIYDWIQETPEVAQVLRAVRDRYADPRLKMREIWAQIDKDAPPGEET